MIRAIVLDLDDTLYLERDYVRSGFIHVASYLEDRGLADSAEVFSFLWAGFEEGRRGDAFDSLLLRWPQIGRVENVEALVERYRQHSPNIELREPAAFADLMNLDLRVGLISDGWPTAQRAKLDALGVEDSFGSTVLTGDWGGRYAKPHQRAFTTIEQEFSLSSSELVYVADNPTKDFIAPNERGWLTWRIRMPGQLHHALEPTGNIASPRLELPSLQEVVAEYQAGS
ncbi:MAG TPA: HAD family hydrolase [Acidimicrobiia bacterium]|nr:HAD family hydrolase [Acidimicrobiia bacterium]